MEQLSPEQSRARAGPEQNSNPWLRKLSLAGVELVHRADGHGLAEEALPHWSRVFSLALGKLFLEQGR